MGMFDYVKCRAMSCPMCGGDLDWQTKDSDCNLDTVYVVDVMRDRNEMRMIGDCAECRLVVQTAISRDTSPGVHQFRLLMAEKGNGAAPPVNPALYADETGRAQP